MKQSEAESRRSEMRPLNERKDFDERDIQLESSGAFIMPQSSASASSGRAYMRLTALFYHTRYI